jgi:monoamine oxidase
MHRRCIGRTGKLAGFPVAAARGQAERFIFSLPPVLEQTEQESEYIIAICVENINTGTVIIGAGYAGIAAAKRLHEAGRDFIVLEARDRIGGRTLTETLSSGATVDLGGQWIGPDQHLTWEWVRETGVKTYECYDSGRNILSYRNRISTYKGTIPRIDPLSLLDLGLAIDRLNRLSSQVAVDAPWQHPRAAKFDSMTVQAWMDKKMLTRKAKFLFATGIETVFAAEPSEISMLAALYYARSGKNLDALLAVTGGAQQTLFVHGAQHLVRTVAEPFAGSVRTGQPVRSVRQGTDHITVTTGDLEVRAKDCIVTVPPALIDRIRFDPMLPQMKRQLHQRLPMGAAMKCFCIYERPFWRKKGLSGQIVSDRYPVRVTFDCSKSDDSHGILLVFVEAREAREFIDLPPVARQRMVVDGLTYFLGEEAGRPLQYIDKCWTTEEWSGGCYTAVTPPGVITQFRNTIREPVGNIRFAGTETATEWTGYIDGAIQSGYREADAILGSISNVQ